jgi:hypothetical protein
MVKINFTGLEVMLAGLFNLVVIFLTYRVSLLGTAENYYILKKNLKLATFYEPTAQITQPRVTSAI